MDLFSYMLGKKSGGSGDSVDAEKLDLYERYFRAAAGESFQDWNPQPIDPNETATFEEAPEKYYIEVETRGIKYRVTGDKKCHIYPKLNPEVYILNGNGCSHLLYVADKNHYPYILDMSRFAFRNTFNNTPLPVVYPSPDSESAHTAFIALPEDCNFSATKFSLINGASEQWLSIGLSFGKYAYGMTAGSIYYSQLSVGDKPVYVMEGFTGNLYLAKLNISAEHLVGIINNLGTGSYTLNIGSHNTEKLTAEQIAVATEKGWTVS